MRTRVLLALLWLPLAFAALPAPAQTPQEPAPQAQAPQQQVLQSPDGKIVVQVHADGSHYDVSYAGQPLLRNAALGIRIDGTPLEKGARVVEVQRDSVDRMIDAPVRQRAAQLREHYNELHLRMSNQWSVRFRAFDDGVAYRIETTLPASEVKVDGETVDLRLAQDWPTHFGDEDKGFLSHNERLFIKAERPSERKPEALASLPAIVDAGNGVRLAIFEADIADYPGLWLKSADSRIIGTFPPYPLKLRMQPGKRVDRNEDVLESAPYLAATAGSRSYPWRVVGISGNDVQLAENALSYLLASPSQIADTSWIRPGKVAWDWYNANNLQGVDFKTGINTQTYKYYIDFAAEHGLEYVILDEGWSATTLDLLHVNPDIDMAELVAHAKKKNVGIILWVLWNALDKQLEPALDQFVGWGVKGIKVDFMQRDDQRMMQYYDRVNRAAAQRKLMIDYHGANRPALMARTWPHIVSVEGVRGLEHFKWEPADPDVVGPEHDLTIPFTRALLGPLDYTPGAMRNAARKSYQPIFDEPMSWGTRAHQLAMYVVYESPLQMLADTPTSYEAEPESMRFLGPVPSTWDETRVLQAAYGDVIVVARRKGKEWWIGAMTDWTARDLAIPLDFLPEGSFKLESWADGVNAERSASDVLRSEGKASRGETLEVHLAPGGGWAARITP